MKTLFELAVSKMSRLDIAKYISMFNIDSNPVEEVLEIRRKADRDLINKEFRLEKTRSKWWMYISFFDEEDNSPRWIKFVNGKMVNILINGMGNLGNTVPMLSKIQKFLTIMGSK